MIQVLHAGVHMQLLRELNICTEYSTYGLYKYFEVNITNMCDYGVTNDSEFISN